MNATPANKRSALEAALRVKTPMLVTGVDALADVLRALGTAAQVDGRGDAPGFGAALERALRSERVVVLLGHDVNDVVRVALADALERASCKVIAVTPARAPSESVGALFPLQMDAARALQGV